MHTHSQIKGGEGPPSEGTNDEIRDRTMFSALSPIENVLSHCKPSSAWKEEKDRHPSSLGGLLASSQQMHRSSFQGPSSTLWRKFPGILVSDLHSGWSPGSPLEEAPPSGSPQCRASRCLASVQHSVGQTPWHPGTKQPVLVQSHFTREFALGEVWASAPGAVPESEEESYFH